MKQKGQNGLCKKSLKIIRNFCCNLLNGRGLEWPSTHQCSIQKIPFWYFMDGMKLSPRGQFTWSVFFFFPSAPFFSQLDFFSLDQFLFPGKSFFLSLFFWPTPDPKFFLGSSYLLQLPTALLPTNHLHPLILLAPSPTHLLLRSLPSLELPT